MSFVHPALCQTAAQGIEGDWKGTLKPPGAELRLVFHITKAADGSLKGTMDSVDQGANGIPIDSISLKDTKLTFAINAIGGSYEGTVNADASAITGTWTQGGGSLPLDLQRGAIKTEHKAAAPSDIDGGWLGTLEAGAGIKLRLVFHITNTEDGLTASMDSLDQGAKGIPAAAVKREGSSLKIEMKSIGGGFQGTINKDLTTIEGEWSQAGATSALTLKRIKDAAEMELRRPQNPTKPYPYREEEIVFENKPASVTLAGTLTLPEGKGPFPAAVLIAGSGPHDRDESLLGHKPFLVLSDYLTRKGIAVLRYDKRGFGKSGGNYAMATTADFASDAEAAFAYLLTRPEINARKVGLIGHSEGAVIAPMVAARNHQVAFIVMMAGSAVPGDQLLVEQSRLITQAMSPSLDQADKAAAEEREVLAMVRAENDNAALEKKFREKYAAQIPEAQLGIQFKQISSPWFRYFITYDPATALRKVTCPVLALNGEKDLQVPPKQNLPAIRSALAGNKNVEIDELPGLNHLFQTAKTGAPAEYAQIEETIAPTVLEKIASWISKQS